MLYFVATPIGNLKDISIRALETLKEVDIIACEDTRKTNILLNTYEIHKRTIAYHKNNEYNSARGIIGLLQNGKNVAVVSDAGMPIISDPGSVLIEKLIENNLPYTIIPGANAGLSALILSGFDATNFTFLGFLPEQKKAKVALLEKIKNYQTTLIFYVSPHNLLNDLQLFHNILGKRKACLVKEITKIFESVTQFTLGTIPNVEIKGEFVIIIEKYMENDIPLKNLTLQEQIDFYISIGLERKQAIKTVAKNNKICNIYKILENK